MTDQEKDTLYSVVLRLVDDGKVLTKLERRDLLNQLMSARCRMTADEILAATKNNRRLRIRRGTSAQNDAYTGLDGEILMDVDTNTLRVHDGETPGGHTVAGGTNGGATLPENIDYVVAWQVPTAENNYTWYRKYASGWVEQGGVSTGVQSRILNLPIRMSNAKYAALLTVDRNNQSGNSVQAGHVYNRTATTIQIWCNYSSGNDSGSMSSNVLWEVKGFMASE